MKGYSPLMPSAEQSRIFKDAANARVYRTKPEILLVEDQQFSTQLMLSVLAPPYKVYTASHAGIAWELYVHHAPDIVFLDIELPGLSGHDLAEAIQKLDPHPYVVMVTANNYKEDILRAQKNGAAGFIAKPYNRQKIFDSIQKFMSARKIGSSAKL